MDQARIQPPILSITAAYGAKLNRFVQEVWRELLAMYRTVHQIDVVKMVIVDLDDTLWRGVLAEEEEFPGDVIEGWPLGVIEALVFLRRRGVILAIVSKNEESNVVRIFDQLLRRRLPLDHFALRRINWTPKTQNIDEIMREANLLPKNVVFVDDNPVERNAIAAAFPDLRVIGADPYALKRILLWSPETQITHVTDESARRGEMIKAQVERETSRKTLSRTDFLNSLGVKIQLVKVASTKDARFTRAFELLNKTNQFNTTGKRWTFEDISHAFACGLQLQCFSVQDKFTEYGLVGVVLIQGSRIVQWVMSCRVLGLEVEDAVLRALVEAMRRSDPGDITADLVETAANFPCRQLYPTNGFVLQGQTCRLASSQVVPSAPSHINFSAPFQG